MRETAVRESPLFVATMHGEAAKVVRLTVWNGFEAFQK
jgi:hypothetical protein